VASNNTDDPIERVLPALYALVPIEQFPQKALKLVLDVVAGDKAEYTEVDLSTGDFRVLVDPAPPELDELRTARREYMSQHPVMAHFLRQDGHEPRLISDFLDSNDFHRLGLYGEFFRYLGVEDQLTVTVSTRASGRPAGVSIDRGCSGFNEHDRQLLRRLRPHLVAARNNAIQFSDALSGTTSEPRGTNALELLTGRQREILNQLSRGSTNGQIAAELDISPETVRKHVENILLRLGLPTRTAAAVYYITRSQPVMSQPWTAYVASMHRHIA